jgi:hypothetical protein
METPDHVSGVSLLFGFGGLFVACGLG